MNADSQSGVHSDVSFTLQTPDDVVFGRDTAAETGSYASAYGDRALLVTDSQLRRLGVVDPVVDSLDVTESDAGGARFEFIIEGDCATA